MSDTKEERKAAKAAEAGSAPPPDDPAGWLRELVRPEMTEWERLPDIGLYMDQVLTLVERQLSIYRRGDERLVTAAMVNNYIKDGLLPRAEAKKYTPTHLALLLVIGTLKQVLSIPDIKRILSAGQTPASAERLYDRFLELQQDALRETVDLIEQVGLPDTKPEAKEETNGDRLRLLVLELVVEARTRVLAAQKVLDMLDALPAEAPPAPGAGAPEPDRPS